MTRLAPLVLLFVPLAAFADVAPGGGCGCAAATAPLATGMIAGAALLAFWRR
ncbi:MAG: hypothetical protein H6736_21460 [Alphaproteobacteria bacterium]|nr:hypothetical protein [Alphaproteobacteria bacterium]MCB9694386.1 hypothetical protein [Alphaproteobacteria bacterium]